MRQVAIPATSPETAMTRPTVLSLLFAPAALLAFAAAPSSAKAAAMQHDHAAAETKAAVPAPKLQAALRQLWHGHVLQTRAYAMAVHAHRDADAKRAADGVVANARQIADAVAGFYGPAAGQRMLQLLAAHWSAVKALTDATDDAAQKKAMTELTANAGEIAKFLSGANPYLPENAVLALLMAHGGHHAAQIRQIMAGDMKAEAETWKQMQAHMDTIADALAGALARQFPAKAA